MIIYIYMCVYSLFIVTRHWKPFAIRLVYLLFHFRACCLKAAEQESQTWRLTAYEQQLDGWNILIQAELTMASAETSSLPYSVFWAACSLRSNDKNNSMMKQYSPLCDLFKFNIKDYTRQYIKEHFKRLLNLVLRERKKQREVRKY